MGFSSCAHGPSRSGTRVSLLCGMWGLPGPGIKPMSPGLQGTWIARQILNPWTTQGGPYLLFDMNREYDSRWLSSNMISVFWCFNLGDGEGNGTPLQCSCLENPMDGGAWQVTIHEVTKSRTQLSNFTFTFHFHALEKEMATHSSVLAWRIPGLEEPGGLRSMGSHRVGHDWSDLAAAAAAAATLETATEGTISVI